MKMARPVARGAAEIALPVLPALLVNGEVKVRLEVVGLPEVVLEPDSEAGSVRQVGDRGVELFLRRRADRKSGLVLVGVDVVELDRINAGRPGLGQPRGELVEDELLRRLGLPGVRVRSGHVGVDVQPELVPEPSDRLAEQAAAAA
jgi:hypothetical protein